MRVCAVNSAVYNGNKCLEGRQQKQKTVNFGSRLSVDEFSKFFTPEQVNRFNTEILPAIKEVGSKYTTIRLKMLTDSAPMVLVRRTISNLRYPKKYMENVFAVPYDGNKSSLFDIVLDGIKDIKPEATHYGDALVEKNVLGMKKKGGYSNIDKAFEKHVDIIYGDSPDITQCAYFKEPQGKLQRTKAHFASADTLFEMHKALNDNPSLLNSLNLTADKNGVLPIHTLSKAGRRELMRAYGANSEDLAALYFANPEKFFDPKLNIEGGTLEKKLWNIQEEICKILYNGKVSNEVGFELCSAFKGKGFEQIDVLYEYFKSASQAIA